ncbi:hypothetical protein SAMN05444581_107100 [Methylocapsa palsarum]|uniref:Uncharacterized protein n=2 Tax=Methylocapsa palsarum TaxID=1612308 RepID=A0A1I3Z789_9HYPH|nr:hypothetical protein SAMN05444581_107100 [Methylocapsa palsarum]
MALCVAAGALPGTADAAPRTIDDCESIQAPDAYNQCLAAFGPVAHAHGGVANVEEPAAGAPDTHSESSEPAKASKSQSRRGHWAHAAHHEKKHQGAGKGGHRHRVAASGRSQGGKRLQFSVVSGHTRLR